MKHFSPHVASKSETLACMYTTSTQVNNATKQYFANCIYNFFCRRHTSIIPSPHCLRVQLFTQSFLRVAADVLSTLLPRVEFYMLNFYMYAQCG